VTIGGIVVLIVTLVAIPTLGWFFSPHDIWWMQATSTERWRWRRWHSSKVPEGYTAVRRRRSKVLLRTSGMNKPASGLVVLIPTRSLTAKIPPSWIDVGPGCGWMLAGTLAYHVVDMGLAARYIALDPARVVGWCVLEIRVAAHSIGSLTEASTGSLARAASERALPQLGKWGVVLDDLTLTLAPAEPEDRVEFERQVEDAQRFLRSRRGRRAQRAVQPASGRTAR
jgi:hypothetical protein